MKFATLARFAAVPVAIALATSLVACSGESTPSKPSASADALEGSDQVSLSKYTTKDTTPIEDIDVTKLGLITDGVISVGTLSDAPPSIFIDDKGNFTGFDNELLKAMAEKLDLEVEFASTDFAALLAQVQNKKFDVGSSSISTTDARRENVGFTNGYDFGFMATVAKTDSDIKGIADIKGDVRVAVVQGTVQDDYVTNTLGLEPVRFADYNTAYQNLKNGQVDAWVAPSTQAEGLVKEEDGIAIVENVINTQNFVAFAVNSDNQALTDALNSALDAVVADGTWSTLVEEWFPGREMPTDWKPGSAAVVVGKATK
ncbi:substrate-binding periplasmic protein [Lysinibacter cavernae]|uniref:Polar amino acid transport system substrate-binding protein n=1 Tax=Lysinibacter cavernae TaxID=1640652 RepID=A0A7X5R3G6_9MICO|nr:ABC transporter substrate-binding protein [Lysinibacter cavernae]NIH54837.1 polar amino acid transport system substrate-binding protein [Lysinibacter cavernae]